MSNDTRTIEQGFKVVISSGDILTSAVAGFTGGVLYEIGQWVVPQEGCGPLAVFRTKENAFSFIHTFYFMTRSIQLKLFESWYVEYSGSVWALWDEKSELMDKLPAGTDLADAVYLIEECKL